MFILLFCNFSFFSYVISVIGYGVRRSLLWGAFGQWEEICQLVSRPESQGLGRSHHLGRYSGDWIRWMAVPGPSGTTGSYQTVRKH